MRCSAVGPLWRRKCSRVLGEEVRCACSVVRCVQPRRRIDGRLRVAASRKRRLMGPLRNARATARGARVARLFHHTSTALGGGGKKPGGQHDSTARLRSKAATIGRTEGDRDARRRRSHGRWARIGSSCLGRKQKRPASTTAAIYSRTATLVQRLCNVQRAIASNHSERPFSQLLEGPLAIL